MVSLYSIQSIIIIINHCLSNIQLNLNAQGYLVDCGRHNCQHKHHFLIGVYEVCPLKYKFRVLLSFKKMSQTKCNTFLLICFGFSKCNCFLRALESSITLLCKHECPSYKTITVALLLHTSTFVV